MSSRRIYLNQDDSAFTRCHPIADMTVEGLERLVDFYARGQQLAGLAFCVNMQRALFESKVWETLIDDFDPALGTDQPVFARSGEAAGTATLRARGIDQFSIWLARARGHGIEAFLTMRMNDCHGLESHGKFGGKIDEGADQGHFYSHATEYWKKSPHLRRAPYRYERSFEGAFDYSHMEVRRHHLNLIAEIFERYDLDGLELDWMRWMLMFAPGTEARGRDILSEFLAEVDVLRSAAEKERGHRIELRHRVPAEPQACLALGYDVPAWAAAGLADQIILSAFGGAANFDYPIALWRRLVGSNVKILALAEAVASPYPGQNLENYHFSYGAASSALRRGADGIYLFNECYRESGAPSERRLLLEMLDHMGSEKTLDSLVRRHPVGYAQVYAPGDPPRVILPIPLENPCVGSNAGRWAQNVTLRIAVGSKSEFSRYVLRLGFSEESPLSILEEMTVRVNTSQLVPTSPPEYEDCMTWAFPSKTYPVTPPAVSHLLHFEVPNAIVLDDVNVVEFVPPASPGRLEWAEILVLPVGAWDASH